MTRVNFHQTVSFQKLRSTQTDQKGAAVGLGSFREMSLADDVREPQLWNSVPRREQARGRKIPPLGPSVVLIPGRISLLLSYPPPRACEKHQTIALRSSGDCDFARRSRCSFVLLLV